MGLNQPLLGRIALITGAAKRIGREISLAMASAGADIIAHYNASADDARLLAGEIEAMGRKCGLAQADLTRAEELGTLVSRAAATIGAPDILVNSASVFHAEKLDWMTFESLMQNMQINAWAPFVLCREFRSVSVRGHIINLLDTRIAGVDLNHAGYIISKQALTIMTRMMALEYAPDIAVNGIAPGLILPPPGKDESFLQDMASTVPLKRHGAPKDIADAAVFLAASQFITGEIIFVDGGRNLRSSS